LKTLCKNYSEHPMQLSHLWIFSTALKQLAEECWHRGSC